MAIPTWKEIVRWLEQRGFKEAPRTGGHLQYVHPPSGVKVTLVDPARAGHKEPRVWELGNVLRALERCGFEKRAVRRDLGMP